MNNYYSPNSKGLARQLRNNSTKGEIIIWECIKAKRLGTTFNRQKPIGTYIVDFYCKELRLVIEIDGESHHSEFAQSKDETRDEYLSSLGVVVMRIEDNRVFGDLQNVVSEIKEVIEQRRKQIKQWKI